VFGGPKFYIGFLRIYLEVEFSRPKNGKIIKSSKQRLETYCFCSVSYYYYYYSPSPPLSLSFFLSVAHELVHGRSQELLDII
jgi:hypothetical protein